MANSISARKRIKQNDRDKVRNRARKAVLKTATRKFSDTVNKGDVDAAQKMLNGLQKTLDQVGAKGTLHKNTVARRKSRMARLLNAAKAG